jgi:ubiquinone/menaquinone biosynthesis C-methylase UbiE
MSFKDYFSQQSSDYAKYRPTYPEALFSYLAGIAPNRQIAWDCATGNGQVAVSLAGYFQQIYATDASTKQIANAFCHDRVTYTVAAAESSGLPDRSIDLLTVGQSLHWFDLDRFYAEAKRVLKLQGVIAVWCYGLFAAGDGEGQLPQVLQNFYQEIEPFWPPERKLVQECYRTISFPFNELEPPVFNMSATWSLDNLIGYLGTWSATQRFIDRYGVEAMALGTDKIKRAWGTPERVIDIRWPIHLRVGRCL